MKEQIEDELRKEIKSSKKSRKSDEAEEQYLRTQK